jgi:hypothetical protein
MAGSLFGCGSIWTMVFIAFDRYNVIVKVNLSKVMNNFKSMYDSCLNFRVWLELP